MIVSRLLDVVALALGAALAVFAVRRLLLLIASLGRRISVPVLADADLPAVTLIVPAHDERVASVTVLHALERLDYPTDRLFIVLVSDGSTDGTAEQFSDWSAERLHVETIALPVRVGKAIALNEALAVSRGDVIAVIDADMRPRPDYLRRMVAAFRQPDVGGAAGFIQPSDPDATPVSRYAAVETWVHQLVKSAGKDRLRLNPPTLGAAAYRTEALVGIGGFPVVPHGTDVAVTVALTKAGWTTRFVPDAIVETGLIRTPREYWTQHVRWSRGSFAAYSARPAPVRRAVSHAGVGSGSVLLVLRRLEAWMLCANYADRLVLLGALACAIPGRLPFWLPVAYLLIPTLEATAAVTRAGVGGRWRYIVWTVVLFPFDVLASVAAALIHLARRPAPWRSPRRHAMVGQAVGTPP